MIDPAKIEIARLNGIIDPEVVAEAAFAAQLNYAACCALLVKESSGGRNVFGGDDGMPFEGAGKVTRRKYRRYCKERDSFTPPHCQGVGPAQLTSKGYQDQSDALGGCWKPLNNMIVGFGIIAAARDNGLSWWECWRRYNAGPSSVPPAGVTYADEVEALHAHFKEVLNP